jgi:hypothetical protein
MIITNNHKAALGIAPDIILQPGLATPVHDWDRIKKVAVVAAWLKAGVLSEAATAPPSKLLAPDRDAIVARLKELGVGFHPQTGVAKLQKLLDEAEAKLAPPDLQTGIGGSQQPEPQA